MVSSSHPNAKFYLNRDIECVKIFFNRRYGFKADINLSLKSVKCLNHLDKAIKASGFIAKELKDNISHLDIMVVSF